MNPTAAAQTELDAPFVQKRLRWPLTAWMSRLFMIPPTVIFIIISHRLLTDPIHGLAHTGIILSTPEAYTDTRVLGAIILTFVLIMLSAIFSRSRLRMGHLIIITLMFLALAARMYGFAVDGTTLAMSDQKQKTIGEALFLVLNSVGLIVQTLRMRSSG